MADETDTTPTAREIANLEFPSQQLVIAADMLSEFVCHLGANDGELDEDEFARTMFLAISVHRDAMALRDKILQVVEADAIRLRKALQAAA